MRTLFFTRATSYHAAEAKVVYIRVFLSLLCFVILDVEQHHAAVIIEHFRHAAIHTDVKRSNTPLSTSFLYSCAPSPPPSPSPPSQPPSGAYALAANTSSAYVRGGERAKDLSLSTQTEGGEGEGGGLGAGKAMEPLEESREEGGGGRVDGRKQLREEGGISWTQRKEKKSGGTKGVLQGRSTWERWGDACACHCKRRQNVGSGSETKRRKNQTEVAVGLVVAGELVGFADAVCSLMRER